MLNNEFPPLGGGTGTANNALLQHFAQLPELEIDLITSALGNREEEEKFADRIRIFKVPVNNKNVHHSSNRELLTYAARALPFALKRHRACPYEFCFAWSAVPAGLIALALLRFAKLQYLVRVCGPDIPGFEQRYKPIYPILAPFIRAIWHGAKVVVAKSEGEAQMIRGLDSRINVTLVPNGVDLTAFQPGDPFPDNGPLRLLCVARLIERKGQHHLIKAVKQLTEAGINVTLDLVGTGDARAANETQVRKLGLKDRIQFLGYVPREEIATHYAKAHVFVLPSYNEGMSVATLEAMAAGLPLIVTRTCGTPELVEEGVNGFLFNWAEVDTLTTHLRCLATDRALARRMAASSRARAEHFSWKVAAERYLEMFEQIGGLASNLHRKDKDIQYLKKRDDLHGKAIRTAFALWYGWKPYGQYAALLEKTQWWPWSEIQALQMRKLNSLLEYAYANVPFYRRRFDEAGVRHSAIDTPADLVRLPLLTRQEIQDHLPELLATGVKQRHLKQNHTGGSTGHPLTFYQDGRFLAWAAADLLRDYRMAGYQLGMRWAFLWGSDYDARMHKGWQGWFMDRVVYNTLWINTFDLTVDMFTEAARQLVRFQPQILVAYVSSATLLAQLVRDKGIEGIRLRAIQTSAEVLTPDDRRLIEETFGCRVFDRYGCREVYNIAHECAAHQGLHVLAENNLVEYLDAAGRPAAPGTAGRIVVTNLNNYVMPFIRYEVGDLGVPSQRSCTCGRGLPLLESVTGRTVDVITSPSGKLLHGEFFTHLFFKLAGIRQFRVVQKTRVDLHVQVVPGTGFDQQASFTFLEKAIHRYGDPGFRVRFELCDHIPPGSSGKYRFTISHVPLDIEKDDSSAAAHIPFTHVI